MDKYKIKKYKVSPDDSVCFAVSVVDQPAVETDFIFLSKKKIEKFVGVEGERKMIYGCALRPDFPIYRYDGKEEYYLEFSKEAIDKMSKQYFKMGFQQNWTAAHEEEVEGLTITESWIKEDMDKDKSVAIGLDKDLPVGSWFIGVHCENDDIWKQVKEGTFHGFSVEALVGLEEFNKIDKEEDVDMNNDGFWKQMKDLLKEVMFGVYNKEEEEKEQNEIEPISIEDMSAETTVETQTEVVETPIAETPAEEPIVEQVEQPIDEEPKNVVEETPIVEEKKEIDNNVLANLLEEIKALKEQNNELVNKVKDLSLQPSAKPLNTNAKPTPSSNYSNWREQMRKYM